jgi:Ca2+-binding RTX toxin-like protein
LDLTAGTIETIGTSGRIAGTVSGFEQIIGGDDTADRFAGSSRDERLFGRGSADELFGGGGADELFGGTGADVLFGGRGDDLLHGGAGDDDLRGGAGLDTANYANAVPGGLRAETTTTESAFGAVTVSLAAGTARGAAGGDALSGIENVYGSAAGDDIAGNAGPNALYGAGGDDLLRGGRGDDILVPGAGDDRIAGGPGNDRVVVDAGDLAVDGGDGWDRLDLGTVIGNVTLDFATGDYRARLYVDTAVWQDTGSSEPRVFEGTALTPRDVLETDPAFADDASDVDRELPPAPSSLEDDAERDAAARFNIMQASRPESYSGSLASIEKVVGGSAVTRLLPSLGVDRFDGTAETSTRDRIDLTRADGGVVFDLATGEARHALVAGDRFVGLEEIRGSRFADRLRGDGGDNTLIGEAGNDRLHGRQGADTLDGGPGNDAMTGGAGNDRFIIDDDDGRDRITDLGADDTLLLDPALWSGALTEAQIAARFGRSEAGGYRLSFADGESVFLIDADRALVVDSLEIA